MKIGPKYKIARRLGSPIFEKTQTQKYALSLARKEKSRGFSKPKSEFGTQLIEKQKARLTYGLGERQFKKYVEISLKSPEPTQKLFSTLESRLDNVLYRAGFTKSRRQARQAASHGHTLVNGRRVTIPSILLAPGDMVSIRQGSQASALWALLEERTKESTSPAWLEVDGGKKEIKVVGVPAYNPTENMFELSSVMEFYSR